MKIYNTKTQTDYDALMIELEAEGYKWSDDEMPTEQSYFDKYGSETTVTACDGFFEKTMQFADVAYDIENSPDIPIIEYKADKQGETDNFIKELTVKIYYNEITKKHYNSYDDAITDCKKEMEKLHDKN